jgi:hypothetical protein
MARCDAQATSEMGLACLAQLSGCWPNVCSIAAARRRVFTQPRSKSEVDQSQRHVGLAFKSRLELDIAAGQRWADSVEKVASLKSPKYQQHLRLPLIAAQTNLELSRLS